MCLSCEGEGFRGKDRINISKEAAQHRKQEKPEMNDCCFFVLKVLILLVMVGDWVLEFLSPSP